MEQEREEGRVVDPLFEARHGLVKDGADGEGCTPAHPPVDDEDAGSPPGAGARNPLTEAAGDAGGER